MRDIYKYLYTEVSMRYKAVAWQGGATSIDAVVTAKIVQGQEIYL